MPKFTPWDKEEIVKEIPKGARDKYIVSFCTSADKAYVNLREWYEDKDGSMRPGRAGATFSVLNAADVGRALIEAAEKGL
jgi:hypothetical protein